MTPRLQRAVVWSLVGAAVAAVVAAELRRRALAPEAAALTVGSIDGPLFALLGGLILHRRPRHRLGVLYLGCGVLLATFHLTNGPLTETWPAPVVWFNSWAWAVGPLLIITFGMLLLPDGDRPRTVVGRVAWWSAVAVVVTSVVYLPYDADPMPLPLTRVLPAVPAPVVELGFVLWAAIAGVAVLSSLASVVVGYRRAADLHRARLRWIAYCTFVTVVLYLGGDLVTRLPGFTHEHNLALVVAIPAVGVAVAIVRHRMFDIDRLLARTLSYALVTVAVIGIYLAAVMGVTTAIPSAGDSDLVIAISTLGAAAAFRPVRRRVQGTVDRRFHRSPYDAEQLVASFAARLRDQVDLTTVECELTATCAATLRPSSISLWTGSPADAGEAPGTLAT